MSISKRIHALHPAVLGVAAITILGLAACGGGGSGSSNDSSDSGVGDVAGAPGGTAPPPVPTTGQVAILFTDAPTDAFCRILATVERIELLGTGGSSTNIFTGPRTVNVLRMRNYRDFFAIAPVVPVGSYEKVRMTLSDLALVECDGAGHPEPRSDWEHPKLPGNGKLDLNPRGSFEVVGGETLVIELDMDMEKSLHVHQTGNGNWQFRPVIFVNIRPDNRKLVRVFGAARDLGATTFELCPLEPTPSTDDGHSTPSTECLDVVTDADTGIFDETGARVGLGAVASGDLLTAIGFLGVFDDDDGDNRRDDLRLDAVVIELGDRGTFEHIAGTVLSAAGNNDIFVFDPRLEVTPLEAANDGIDVRLQSGTRIFAIGSNAELTSAALQPGATGEVDGVFTDPATSGEPLKSSLIVLDQNTTPSVALLGGVIQGPIPADDDPTTPATRRFAVDTDALNDKCVKTDTGTRYLTITETVDRSETADSTFADLAEGDTADVFGAVDAAETACVLADTVQKYVSEP